MTLALQPAGCASQPLPRPVAGKGGWRWLVLLLLPLWWLVATAPAAAADVRPVPALTAPLTDEPHLLSAADAQALNAKLLSFSQQKGSQVAVLIVSSTEPETIFDYSFRVADSWKLGRKGVDDGVLLVVAVDDRKTHLQVGYGLEGAIPDARAKQILQDIIAPHFRQGDFAGGLNAGVDAVIALINGEQLPAPTARGNGQEVGNFFFVALVAGVIASFVLRAFLGDFLGGLGGGGVAFALAMILGLAVGAAMIVAVFAFIVAVGKGGRGVGGGGWSGGGFGGSSGGGGFSGGGGGFGGGGASGSW